MWRVLLHRKKQSQLLSPTVAELFVSMGHRRACFKMKEANCGLLLRLFRISSGAFICLHYFFGCGDENTLRRCDTGGVEAAH